MDRVPPAPLRFLTGPPGPKGEDGGLLTEAEIQHMLEYQVAQEPTVVAAAAAAVDANPTIATHTAAIARTDPGTAGTVGQSLRRGPSGPAWGRKIVSADWYSDINSAITAAGQGGTVELSPGVTYMQATPILFIPGISLIGGGMESSVIAVDAEAGMQTAASATVTRGVTLRDFTITKAGDTPIGIDFRGITRSLVDRVKVSWFTDAGVVFGAPDGYVTGWTNTLRESEIVGTNIGLRFEDEANNIRVMECVINPTNAVGAIGIHAPGDQGTNHIAFNDIGYIPDGRGLVIEDGRHWTVIGNRFEDTAVTGIEHNVVELAASVRYCTFVGNTYTTNSRQPYIKNLGEHNQILDALNRTPEYTDTHWQINTPMRVNNRVDIRHASSASDPALTTGLVSDANRQFMLRQDGGMIWSDPASGAIQAYLRLANRSLGVLGLDDNRYWQLPRHTSLPSASSSRRGTMIRVEGATGVADGTYVCRKKADDTYEWVNLTP